MIIPSHQRSLRFLACGSLVSLISVVALEAQLPLEPAAQIDSLDGPNAIVLADLDRDGDLDALTASGPDGTAGEVAWWAFDATSGWSTKRSIDAAFVFAKDVVAADLDRDGDLDVVAVSFQADEVAWWENTAGDASIWSAKKIIAASAGGAIALAVGDVDGDGAPDVLACLRAANSIRWFENDGSPGNGGWVAHTVNAAAFSEATGVAVGDLDRDGDLDVAGVALLGDQVAWWENDGSPGDDTGGDGNSWTFHTLASGIDGARDLALADLDRDGDLDLAAVATVADELVWFANTSGDAAVWSAAMLIASLNGARDLVARDLDFDGDTDLLSAGQDGGRLAWWENNLGATAAWSEHEIDSTLNGARGVALGDVDRDGDLDIAATGHSADVIAWWENVPIHRGVEFVEDVVATDFADTAIASDIDQDGDLDIVGGGLLRWYERQGSAWQAHDIDFFAGLTGGLLTSVAVGDLDGDGDPDVAGTNNFRALWWENDGSPRDDMGGGLGTSWTRHQVSDSHSQAQGISTVDLDQDGFLDLLAFDLSGDDVLWWENDGSPGDDLGGDGNSWTERVVDNLTDGPRAAIARDIDRDGDLDVMVVSQTHSPAGERVSFWRNNGGGISWTRQPIGAGGPLTATVDDVDADGDLDVVAGAGTGIGEGTLQFHEQQPPGDGSQWTAGSPIGVLDTGQPFVNEMALADFDLDGDLDAGAVGDRDNTYWFENPASGPSWSRHPVTIGQFDTDGLIAQEADGRGAPDLIAASNIDSKIVIWENRAAQALLIGSDVSVSPLTNGIEAAMLRINAITLGRSGDNQAEIARLDLLLEEAPGAPLSGPEAGSILANLHFYEDIDGSGDFDPDADDLIGTLLSPAPVDGVVSFVLPDFLATIGSASFRNYFLVVEMTADATAQATDSLRITLLTRQSRMEDAIYDSPLTLKSPEDVATQVLAIVNPIFDDGFESGDTSLWSVTTP